VQESNKIAKRLMTVARMSARVAVAPLGIEK